MDDNYLRIAYEKTALHRLGVPFERAIRTEGVRRALEASAIRSTPQTAQPAKAACR